MHTAHIAFDPMTATRRIQTCTDHSRAVAALTKRILAPCGLGSAGYLAGLLHDCGKFTDEFDDYLARASRGESIRKGSVIHTFAGVRYLMERFHSRNNECSFSDLVSELLAICVGSHHGLMDVWDEREQDGFAHRLKHQPGYDARAIASFHDECASREEVEALYREAEQDMLNFYQHRLLTFVKSQAEAHYALGLLVRLITSAVVDADRTDTRCFMQGLPHPQQAVPTWAACVEHVNAHIAAFPRTTPIQRVRGVFSDHCAVAAENEPGLYRLELPTGGGKTLAALRFAVLHAEKNKLRRIIYAAPLLSIIEQNAAVIRSAVGDSFSVLEHHSNLLQDHAAAEEATQADLLQETWDAPMIITTFVQMLNTLFSGKMSSVRRFHALCESVIVIDEVQSLPPKLLSMFSCAVNFLVKCCRTTVVLCSATQPAFDRVAHPMLPCERLIGEDVLRQYAPLFKRTAITDGGSHSMQGLVELSVHSLETVHSLLVVCNTKREAAELFHALKAATDARLFHLSAGMCMAHRKQVLTDLTQALAGEEKLICVSTQLIEAGVDVSFGSVIRLSAGLDSIVQAAGRCNRHGEHAEPQPVRICRLKAEQLGSLREIREAQSALDVLLEEYRRHPEHYEYDLASDAAVRDYYRYLYVNMPQGVQDYPVHGQRLFELLSTNVQLIPDNPPRYCFNQAFRTAGEWFEVFDSASESVLVPFGEGACLIDQMDTDRARYDIAWAEELLQSAKPYTVSLQSSQIDRMKAQGAIYTLFDGCIYVLSGEHYDNDVGVKEESEQCSTLIL